MELGEDIILTEDRGAIDIDDVSTFYFTFSGLRARKKLGKRT